MFSMTIQGDDQNDVEGDGVPDTSIIIQAVLAPKLNLAFYQNAVPTIRELILKNNSGQPLKRVELTLSSQPAFIKPKTWRIDIIDSSQHYHLPDLDVPLEGALLSRLTEAEKAQATFVLTANGEEVSSLSVPIELLARNQWGGIGHMPEMVAAFVQPNERAVDRLLKKAAEILRKHNKSGALNGYEGGPKRAWELASAIWSAVGSMGIDYSLPPASFEKAGQKIRGPEQIAESGIATCMDTTLFFCAALEQCGLNPLLVFIHGHVFAGVWLKSEEFTNVVIDDITALRKRVKLKEMVLFETTLATQHPCPSFGRAVDLGAQQISESNEDKFELAIDISRARLQRIKPLASEQVVIPTDEPVGIKQELEPVFEEAPDLPDDEIAREDEPDLSKTKDRLDRWQRKLLDLSLRNSLLNFRTTKRALKLDAPDPGRIEDMLADGHTLKLLPRPDLMDGSDLRSQAIYETRTNEDLRRTHALEALQRKELMVSLPKDEVDIRLVELYRFARAALQEGGANTLFLALGFLSWTRDDKDDKRYRAPLILIPVTLSRRSVRSGFALKLHDDEPRFNPTLIEMLRQDFNLELPVSQGELPKDDHGLDIDEIWKSVAHAIKDIRGWEVAEDVVLSTFSFAKYLMWKDLVDRTEQLKKSPVVKHLIDTPRDPYLSDHDFPAPSSLDTTHGPEQIFCPLPADSSQLSAVIAAAKGKDFVLIGPPGTGKSQTIANLIAQCLAEQKTVLFVSEKIAALDVVYRRLRDVGLGDFCLELHSNKARKLEVLENLRKAWDAQGGIDADEWQKEACRLKTLRDQLNDFVEHLHRKRHNGLTAYSAIGRIVSGNEIPKLGLTWSSPDIHSKDDLFELEELVEELDINAGQVGGIADSPLALISNGDWSPNWTQSLLKAVSDVIPKAKAFQEAAANFLKATGLPNLALDTNKREGLSLLSQVLPDAAGCDWRFSLRPDVGTISKELQHGLKLIARHKEVRKDLSAPWSADVVYQIKHGLDLIAKHGEVATQLSAPYADNAGQLNVEQLDADWKKAENAWWPFNHLKRKKVRSALAKIVDGKQELDLPADITRLVTLRKLEAEISSLAELSEKTANLWSGFETKQEEMETALTFQTALASAVAGNGCSDEGFDLVAAGRCGAEMAENLSRMQLLQNLESEIEKLENLQTKTSGLWTGLRTNEEETEKAVEFQKSLAESIAKIATSAESLSAIKAPLELLLGDGNALLEPTGPLSRAGRIYRQTMDQYQAATETLATAAATPCAEILDATGDVPESLVEQCQGILQLEPKLHAWCAWRKVRCAAVARGLTPLVEAIENGSVELGKAGEAFKTDYARWWLNVTVDDDEVLRTFVSATHEKRIEDFRMLDDHFTSLTRSYVRAGLCSKLPDQEDVTRNSEWGLLRREMQKKKRHLPLREMMNNVPSVITKLAPCLMMSPISIAQYLSTETALFDVVVFDEASQIPVWDAIGAIARGKQVVMVGDPKQLPPTSFFDRAEADGDEDADIESDLESILDECLGANLPTLNLSWHYRSRHESLIAFSNNRYYGGGLVTFPSPTTNDRAVSLQYIEDGIYEKGGARINKNEARALVKHIVARLKDPDFKASEMTIGVVTFNSEQQRLIEDLLDNERRKSPSLESYFSDDLTEPLFVKNLESVQGDERDIMYFSITYGPDLTGAISMNFGPMNRDGGERRLNVAITRARHELLVFSSLKPEQIDLSRTQAIGVKDLKHFMEFAERGPRAIAEAVHGTIGEFDSPFEEAVAEALARKGWQVHPQVGVSSFRIDLGVVNPDAPGKYLAGVECDGATYHRSATARDRDKLREQVLRGLGWEILRIWSTDWWIDAEGALEKTHAALEHLLAESRAQQEEKKLKKEQEAPVVLINDKDESEEEEEEEEGPSVCLNPDAPEEEMPSVLYAGPATTSTETNPTNAIVPPLPDHCILLDHQKVPVEIEQTVEDFSGRELLSPYVAYEGMPFQDPRSSFTGDIADGLCSIIEIEGPMLTKRAYDIYLRGCGIKRMGRELKSEMNKALQYALRQNRVILTDELSTKGFIHAFVRAEGSPQLSLRERGPRTFEEIPPSEVLAASYLATQKGLFQKESDEHLHAILEIFDLKRLTTATKTRLLEIISLKFDTVYEWIEKFKKMNRP
jgi:very-short-patch-repair endonuclease